VVLLGVTFAAFLIWALLQRRARRARTPT
jgi:hypothetical protein